MHISGCAAFWASQGKPEPLEWASSLKGRLTEGRQLADLTWLRVGGPAEIFYQPADLDDLCQFMKVVPHNVPVFPMGVGSNLIVRDGGMAGVVLRLGRAFAEIRVEGPRDFPAILEHSSLRLRWPHKVEFKSAH